MKRTYQPSKVKRNRKHGFRARMKTKAGKAVLARRRRKGRAKLSVANEKTLTKSERLGRQSDLRIVFASGSRINTAGAKIVYLKNNLPYSRFAVTIVRKFGNAVERNKIKRLFRELYRLNKYKILTGWDIIFIIYPGNFDKKARNNQFYSLINKAKLNLKVEDSSEL